MTQLPVANWYPDPNDPTLLRWWDGTQWTPSTQPASPDSPSITYQSFMGYFTNPVFGQIVLLRLENDVLTCYRSSGILFTTPTQQLAITDIKRTGFSVSTDNTTYKLSGASKTALLKGNVKKAFRARPDLQQVSEAIRAIAIDPNKAPRNNLVGPATIAALASLNLAADTLAVGQAFKMVDQMALSTKIWLQIFSAYGLVSN